MHSGLYQAGHDQQGGHEGVAEGQGEAPWVQSRSKKLWLELCPGREEANSGSFLELGSLWP